MMGAEKREEAAILRRVEQCVERFAMFSPGDRVVVGCSGGADSTCLLHMLTEGLSRLRLECVAVYVDHGIRAGAADEARWVEERARSFGAQFALERVDVPARVARTGESVQEAARFLRYKALSRAMEAHRARRIAVGHTRSDQAETLLMQLLRGAGTKGLSGMAPVRGALVRPLLGIGRSETEAYCRSLGLSWLDDPSNEGTAYLRNRVRQELLPLLESYRPGVEARLAATAEILREEDHYLEEHVAAELKKIATPLSSEGGLVVKGEALSRLPLALARRAVRALLAQVEEEARSLPFDAVEAVLAFARERAGGGRRLELGPVQVVREYGDLHFLRANSPHREETAPAPPVELAIPGSTQLPWAEAVIEASFHPADAGGIPYRGASAVMDWEKLLPPLVARRRRPGDRLQPLGMKGRKKVKDVLIDAKVPRRLRDRIPIVEDRKGVVWVAGYTLAERVRVTSGSRRLLKLEVRSVGGAKL